MIQLLPVLDFFARGGGGGSSSGGGGGGGGGGESLFVALGYAVGYYGTHSIKKMLGRERAKTVSAIAMVGVTVLLVAIMIIGSSFIGGYIIVMILIGLWIGWYTQIHDVWAKLSKKIRKTNKELAKARQTDSAWDETALHAMVQTVFLQYQDDWTRQDASRLYEYCTADFAQKTTLLLCALTDLHRQNAVMQPRIIKMDTVDMGDNADNNKDWFTVLIEAQADDRLIDVTANKTIFVDNSNFAEFWTFKRSESRWLLSAIEQSTADNKKTNYIIKDLAAQNGMFYSLDMGWLLIPERGQVFLDRTFGFSDINNHVIGMYNNVLMQIYTYNSRRSKKPQDYVIGQITVPKAYGAILVRPKKRFFTFRTVEQVMPTENSQKYTFEWQEFNKKYEVYATDADRLATFELINPKFMQMMHDIDTTLVLEVVDSIIYFRVRHNASLTVYTQLLNLLKQAHKELKL